MKCRFCGKKIKKDSNICEYCGKEVTEGINTDELIDAMPELHDEFDNISRLQAKDKKKKERKEKREQTKSKKGRIILAILLVLVIVAGVVAGMLYYKNTNKEPEVVVPTTSAIDGEVKTTFKSKTITDWLVTDEASAKAAIALAQETLEFADVENEYELYRKTEFTGSTFYRFRQVYQGIPVYGGEVVLMADKSGKLVAYNGSYITTKGLTATHTVDKATAGNTIIDFVSKMSDNYQIVTGTNMTDVEKVVVNTDGKTYLAYKANISGYNRFDEYNAFDVFVDAVGGKGIGAIATSSFENESELDETEEEYIYEISTVNDKFNWNDEKSTIAEERLPIADIESGNVSPYIASVKTAMDRAYNFFDKTFGYKGLDGEGSKFKVYINSNVYEEGKIPTGNALYTNDKLMFFREDLAQGEIEYNSVVHEYAHGVIRHTAGLSGTKELTENAVIAEGLADIFAELAELKLAGTADWIHGERNMDALSDGYYMFFQNDSQINTVQDCYAYSTVVSHFASYMNSYIKDVDTLCEYWFKVLNLMTVHTDFNELNTILYTVAESMYDAGRLDAEEMSAITAGIQMLTQDKNAQGEIE